MVHVKKILLQPLGVKIHPEIQHIQQVKNLNDQFTSLIDQVRAETRLKGTLRFKCEGNLLELKSLIPLILLYEPCAGLA